MILIALYGCLPATSCGPDSERVAFAKSLSEDRLKVLYQDSKALLSSEPNFYIPAGPDEFSDLNPINMRAWRSDKLGIKLEGCFDHFVFLIVDTNAGEITVEYGEGPDYGEDLLWADSP